MAKLKKKLKQKFPVGATKMKTDQKIGITSKIYFSSQPTKATNEKKRNFLITLK